MRHDEPTPAAEPPGIKLGRVREWLDEHQPGLLAGPLTAELIAGGRSNLTYRVTDGAAVWALRRPPLGHVLPTAHDMAREFRVIAALANSPVPVPHAIALCEDASVLGQPFYLMSFVDGVIIDSARRSPDSAAARRATELLVDTLAALHAVDPAAAGLADFGRPDGFRQRQISRWHKQFLASRQAGKLGDHPVEEVVVTELGRALPADGPIGIVHGDYRLTNVLFDHGLNSILAVVDWEMATIGDPLMDVGLLYVYHELAGTTDAVMPTFRAEDGFLGPAEMVARYSALTGTPTDSITWYIAFGYFKLAVIAAGIHARHLQGLTVGAGFDQFGPLVDVTLERAIRTLGGH